MKSILSKKLLLLIIFLALLMCSNYLFDNWIQNNSYKIFSTFTQWFENTIVSSSHYIDGFINVSKLVQEHKDLQKKVATLQGNESLLQEVKLENEKLRQLLDVRKNNAVYLSTKIIDVQRTSQVSTLIIDVGKDGLVAEGMPVIVADNILVGVVNEVYGSTAKVLLVDDPRFVVSVRVQGTSIVAKATGILQNSFKVDLVTSQEVVKKNDKVVTSGLDAFPSGLYLGELYFIEVKDEALFQIIEAKNAFNLYLGPELFVITL